jgi:RNA polymerase sigma factor (sigma-70 family)
MKTNPSSLSDAALIDAARQGDTTAFAELWNRHASAGRAVAAGHSSSFDPDDVVAESFARIFEAVSSGGGPDGAFRPYLFATIRNTAAGWGRARREVSIDDAEKLADPALTEDGSLAAVDRSLMISAWEALPANWQEALWYGEVEQLTPRQAAPLLGITPSAVASLTYRAREGLRQAWIQAHLASVPDDSEHGWTLERLGSHSRHGLGKRDRARVDRHLANCAKCSMVAAEARQLSSALAVILLPLVAGAAGAAAYAASARSGKQSPATGTGTVMPPMVAAAAMGAAPGSPATGLVGAVAPRARLTGGVGIAVAAGILAVLVAGGAAAAIVVRQLTASDATKGSSASSPPPAGIPDPPTADDEDADDQLPPAPSDPVPAPPQPAPRASEGPRSPVPPPLVSVVAPAVPAISTPVDGIVTGALSIAFGGTGTPGGVVQVSATAPPPTVDLGTATVAADGTWTLTADLSALFAGTYTLVVVESKDGLSSPAASLTLTVQRPNPPSVTLDLGGTGTDFPIAKGIAEPYATVTVSNGTGPNVVVQADASGAWSTSPLTGFGLGSGSVSVTQTSAGATSAPSAAQAFTLVAPGFTVTPTLTGFYVYASGMPNIAIETLATGSGLGGSLGVIVIPPTGLSTFWWAWAMPPGSYTVAVRYSDGKRFGPSATLPLTTPGVIAP